MVQKKNESMSSRYGLSGILRVVFVFGLVSGVPVLTSAGDPIVGEMERQIPELEAKQPDSAHPEEQEHAARSIAGEFVQIEPGCFEMGSPEWEEGRNDDETPHRVCITRPFDLGKYEVTQGQWERVMGGNPSHFSGCGSDCPVEQVSWNQVQNFIRALNRRTGLRYRLPTEAEWEYACRSGGREELYCGGEDVEQIGWYSGNSGVQTHPVGRKRANGLGLYDMSGNVLEWVQDWYNKDYYRRSPVNDPEGPSSGTRRVYRGGGWHGYARILRSAARNHFSPGGRGSYLGFRLARSR
jgi:formylglycine-generating enzyme